MNISPAKPADAQAIADIFNLYLGTATMVLEPHSAADYGHSIRFHENFGFRMVGTQVGIGFVGGKRIDTVIMERVW